MGSILSERFDTHPVDILALSQLPEFMGCSEDMMMNHSSYVSSDWLKVMLEDTELVFLSL